MCLSAEVSLGAAAVLIPGGAVAGASAWRADRRYLMIATLPLLFGLQQLVEGLIWIEGHAGNTHRVGQYSLLYMFFTWIAWPIWVPLSAYFLEGGGRRNLILLFVIAGAMLGGLQFIPYFVHDGWLATTFLRWAVRYQDINLLDGLVSRTVTYAIYVAVVIVPFLLVRGWEIKIFGLLVAGVLVITYAFFSYAYISVFCFGGAVISLYLLALMWRRQARPALA
ncbi:hypothetical protein AKG11_32665 [Shinella sp. SUS2]|uniref:DUF6629 family protein n=1 Tax=unclassified Shinella TaxID=2643062 RepID=UPI00067FBF45|nr:MULTISPECIES: DUF6629 family protein [unclassified Shinella]KNY11877.1 hypothetical protein AKG11_32665 [Shinella sp. SUS2]KOC71561.1 hypothetical protein AKG10_32295 [Shinella sp. GWS1]